VILSAVAFGPDAIVHGLILGLVYGVLAVGLVLVYRASGVVNFAYGETGALGAAVLAVLILNEHWSWLVALPAVLALGAAIGAATEVLVARRLANRPRLTLLVATIGLAQLLLVAQYLLPSIRQVAPYPSPLHRRVTMGSIVLRGPDFVALAAVPAIVVAITVWLGRTPTGRALRAAGDNREAAELAGVRTGRLSLLAWSVAGVVSTATAVLANPLQGTIVGRPTEALGAGLLVRALAAALVGRLRSVPLALAGGLGVGLVQAWANTGRVDPAVADLVFLLAILVMVLVRPAETDTGSRPAEGELARVPPVRRWDLRSLGGVVADGWQGGRGAPAAAVTALAVVAAFLAPVVAGRSSQLFLLSRTALYAVVGISLVVLTGWAGQLSLGQFALAGIGTFSAAVLERHGVPFWLTVPIAAVLGGAVSLVVGLPALRVRGLDLALTTLALAVACSSWLFTRGWLLGAGGTATVDRGRLLGLDLRGSVAYYETCLVVLLLALGLAAAIRRADLGRRFLAIRSNERRSAALGVPPAATKLGAFALAGALAALAGALLGGLRVQSAPGDFGPQESLRIVAITVIGGAGSALGAVLGAVVVLGIPAIFGDTTVAGLLPSGLGLLVLILVFPGGLMEVAARLRAAVGWRRVPGGERAGAAAAPGRAVAAPGTDRAPAAVAAPGRLRELGAGRLDLTGVTVRFGGRVALDAVDLGVAPGEMLGLIGGNGAGKTTVLDVVSGFLATLEGDVRIDGRDVRGVSAAARARDGLGRVLQDARLFDDLTLAETVLLATPGPARLRPSRAADALELLGLTPWSDQPCQRLSTGTRRLAELACVVVRRPSLLLLDEPTAGLAQRESEAFGPLLGALREELGATVVLVEHDVPLVVSVADRLVCLGAGQVLASGSADTVLADPGVVASFLGGDPRAVQRSGPGTAR